MIGQGFQTPLPYCALPCLTLCDLCFLILEAISKIERHHFKSVIFEFVVISISKITNSTPLRMGIGDLNTPVPQFSGLPIGRMAWVEETLRKIGKRENDL